MTGSERRAGTWTGIVGIAGGEFGQEVSDMAGSVYRRMKRSAYGRIEG